MTTSNDVLNTKKGPSTIMRAKFGPGMLLQHEDLEQLNTYTRDLSRLLFRSFFGCGVVCGLTVSVDTDNCGKIIVTVQAGVALNCLGDPIYVPKDVQLNATDGCDPNSPPLDTLYVWLCSCPKCCAPRTPSCGCDEGESKPACTREVDWYEVYVGRKRPECACGCDSSKKPADNTTQTTQPTGAQAPPANPDDHPCKCKCVDPCLPCYKGHYDGTCGCKCEDSNCVILACLNYNQKDKNWTTDHSVRRFIRPVLIRDPKVAEESAKPSPTPSPATPSPAPPSPALSAMVAPTSTSKTVKKYK
jgi:hypothetical protein